MDKLKALFLAIPALFVLALKAGLAIGATGTAIEVIGDFLTAKFASSKVKTVGVALGKFGRKLEAIGTDIPKFVEDFRKWYAVIAKMLGLALVFFLVVTALQACTPAQREAESAKVEECLRRSEVQACVLGVAADCAELMCTASERTHATLACLRPCFEGAGGAGGSAGAQ